MDNNNTLQGYIVCLQSHTVFRYDYSLVRNVMHHNTTIWFATDAEPGSKGNLVYVKRKLGQTPEVHWEPDFVKAGLMVCGWIAGPEKFISVGHTATELPE